MSSKIAMERAKNKPPIVCLCGSTRFMDLFHEQGWKYTLSGFIVLTVGVVKSSRADAEGGHGGEALGQEVADMLDELHKRKIDLADYVFIINKDGYIGESTKSEIKYAKEKGKRIVYMEPDKIEED